MTECPDSASSDLGMAGDPVAPRAVDVTAGNIAAARRHARTRRGAAFPTRSP